MNPNSRSLSVVCSLNILPKWDLSSLDSYFKVFFRFVFFGGLVCLAPLLPRPSGGSLP